MSRYEVSKKLGAQLVKVIRAGKDACSGKNLQRMHRVESEVLTVLGRKDPKKAKKKAAKKKGAAKKARKKKARKATK